MYNDQNNNYTHRTEENGENNYSGNGYPPQERTPLNTYENTREQNGYETNGYTYNADNRYGDNSYSSNGYNANTYSANETATGEYSANTYASNTYNTYGDNSYANSGYNTDSSAPGYGQDSAEYLDLLDKAERLSTENEELHAAKRTLRVTMIVSLLLLVGAVGYLVFSEVKQPLFGKWPRLAQEHAAMVPQIDTLHHLKQQYDSLREVNNILVENATPSISAGVFFEVQIGAFQNFDLQKYGEDLARLRGETEEGMNKYVLGRFRNFKRAEAFKTDVQRMGINDAFIVATIDGRRVELAEAIKASKRMY
ncbi:MAG TPA: hypothetical protein VF646_19835 [Cytophagales bacterium]|jgi:hypothetical protein